MPLYEYQCTQCGDRREVLQKFSDPPLSHCEKCGGDMKKLQSSPAIQFKGSGFYKTDYPSSTSKGDGGSKSESGAKAESGAKGESGGKGETSTGGDSSSKSDSSSRSESSSKRDPSSKSESSSSTSAATETRSDRKSSD
jgi:putative FmdB family regulatory protein